MKKHYKLFATFFILFVITIFSGPTAQARSIYSVSGTMFKDDNRNGSYDVLREAPVKTKTIKLYDTLDKALEGENPIQITTTSRLGSYNFKRLKKGTYYLQFAEETDISGVQQSGTITDKNSLVHLDLLEVNVNSLASRKNIAVAKPLDLNLYVFQDLNMNGILDTDESLEQNKTLVFVNLEKFTNLALDGGLNFLSDGIDSDESAELTSAAMKGTINIGDGAIILDTTKRNSPILMKDVDPGVYLTFRSPYNLGMMGGDLVELYALLELMKGNVIEEVINNPELINSGDLTTNPDTEYIKNIASLFQTILNSTNHVELNALVDQSLGMNTTDYFNQLYNITKLIEYLPGMKLILANTAGTSYEINNFKVTKTTDIYFGIRTLVSLNGTAFLDANGDGIRNGSPRESLTSVELGVYNETGKQLATVVTPDRVGSFNLTGLPYESDLYLVLETEGQSLVNGYSGGDIPAALVDKQIVAKYYLSGASADYKLKQDVAIKVE